MTDVTHTVCTIRKIGHAVRLSSETSFDSKQSKLEPKSLFRLFRSYIETVSVGVSKQTTLQPKQMKGQQNKQRTN